jgi:CTP:molybdopterin cytidylyltransferase MocA
MSENEMVERGARALCTYDDCTLTATDTWNRGAARALIKSMLEPTQAMIERGSIMIAADPPWVATSSARSVWRAMVTAALEKPVQQ